MTHDITSWWGFALAVGGGILLALIALLYLFRVSDQLTDLSVNQDD